MPAGLQPRAAVGYTFAIAAEVAALVGAGPAIRTEIDSSAAHSRPPADRSSPRPRRSPAHPRLGAGALRVRVDRSGGLPLEVPGQRERRAARIRAHVPRARPQRDRRLGGGRGRRLQRRVPRGPGPAPTGAPARRADRRADRRPCPGRGPDRDRGRDPDRAPALGGDARRPDLARAAAREAVDPTPVDVIEDLKDRLGRP